ncbi:MAG TPA: glycoside hydrolase family 97 N-terminal domain-containing protein, partial [Gemmatimonadales bacterium]|nr:glycoside hydrolase family 97 N-terminal domain-containing protein [Gemmatimonadales bacterium]
MLAATMASAADNWSVSSPDGAVVFELRLDAGGALSYRVALGAGAERTDVLAWSPLGITRADQAFAKGLRFTGQSAKADIDDSYTAVHGKKRDVRHRATEVTFSFANPSGARLDVVVRAATDGAAFRYRFPESDPTARTVTAESTGFTVPAGTRAWIAPRSPAGKYTPAYEDLYIAAPAGTASPLAAGWDFPALFSVGGRAWALVTESGLDEHFAASHLAGHAPGNTYGIRLPDAAEGQGVGKAEPSSTLPWTMPWRVVMVGRTPAAIFESTLVNDLAPPSVVADTSWIRPGRVSWSWWSDDDSPKNEAALTSFVDFSAEMGWEYSLVDANWNLMDPAALQRVLTRGRE